MVHTYMYMYTIIMAIKDLQPQSLVVMLICHVLLGFRDFVSVL